MRREAAEAVAATEPDVIRALPEAARRLPAAGNALQLLSAAALLLPGVLASPAQAADAGTESISLQTSRYVEGRRDLEGVRSTLDPLSIDVVRGSVNLRALDRLRLRASYSQDTWSGATPFTTAPLVADGNRGILRNSPGGVIIAGASPFVNNTVLLDAGRRPLRTQSGTAPTVDERPVHILSSASPESRDQADFALAWDWDEASIAAGSGFSVENDYESAYGNLSGRLDFNQKLTSVSAGAGYTYSRLDAILDPDVLPYLTRTAYQSDITRRRGAEILHGARRDWTANLGLTQIINQETLVDVALGYTRSRGFMENPYKATSVLFVDPAQAGAASVTADMRALLEQRPDRNQQWALSGKLVRYVAALDAALHLSYRYSDDDWGVRAHTLEAEWVQPLPGGWTLAPRLRYYAQEEADFHVDYLVSEQAFRRTATDASGRDIWFNTAAPQTLYFRSNGAFVNAAGQEVDPGALNLQPRFVSFDPALLPEHFSSDHRLAGFGSLSASVTLDKEITRGLHFEAGVEYYSRRSALQPGGGDTGDYADFDFHMFSAGLRLDLDNTRLRGLSRARESGSSHDEHAGHDMGHGAGTHSGHQAPAGVMFSHVLPAAGDFMLAWRFGFTRQTGSLLRGSDQVRDADVVQGACAPTLQCRYVPTYMNMKMHMVDLMYAPTANLTLMLMPQFMEMDMNLRELAGRPPAVPGVHEHTGIGGHASGSIGDTVVAGLYRLGERHGGTLHAGLGLSVPTGKVDLELRRMFRIDGGLMHFDMQTGSGTWDLLPSLTWTRTGERLQLGAQLSAVARLESRNDSGYQLGDTVQASVWTSHAWPNGVAASLRGVYSLRGEIAGDFDDFNARIGPMDYPQNQGGRAFDAGVGLSYTVPAGRLAGHSLAIEWTQPLYEHVNGVQLPRQGSVNASWQLHF